MRRYSLVTVAALASASGLSCTEPGLPHQGPPVTIGKNIEGPAVAYINEHG